MQNPKTDLKTPVVMCERKSFDCGALKHAGVYIDFSLKVVPRMCVSEPGVNVALSLRLMVATAPLSGAL